MRIYEFAKQKNISSKEILHLLEEKGFAVVSHMSVLTEEAEAFLAKHFGGAAEKNSEKNKKSKK